ncbi:MAG: glycosyltransferase family 2 protein [Gammaproteobacteria bacterium]|nr:glycosyltransferase family 2 protein [Gammaproteobacteria bacterium]MCY4278242.1 glycosyltransferase family 2 protein [Gammaproteobacteria bacterium]
MTIGVVIPALNEELSVGLVVSDLLALKNTDGSRIVDDLVVCDNGSTDATAERAREAGGRVVHEGTPGYGAACLAAVDALENSDVILFTDADQAFHAQQAMRLLAGIKAGADLVIGSRTLGKRERHALTSSQRFGNWLACRLIRLFWGQRMTDLGPFRAIRHVAYDEIKMRNRAYGWTVEMQVKAIARGLNVLEVPVDTRQRIGRSKISGTIRGVIGAGFGILGMIAKLRLTTHRITQRRIT